MPDSESSTPQFETPALPKRILLKIVGGESNALAYRQAITVAGRLIDGGLWNGESPIHVDDVYAVSKKMKPLANKDFSLFTLEDFVKIGKL
ncbi:hypothetical protein G4Y79_09255 [Phototrophicus methaneseepsis]|uniref:Uncharacterized protein n=1 Tax=Phototrophicus methaneseepsis TaxID=2710758 RepID=A0A7S8ECP4_9CHLR|nr:hypothetical protein [Phototrophicus methaneseepsis]QPC84543.1 hypothetical protein G4Y79_09255 [Phototrophicus methaneseepsis]